MVDGAKCKNSGSHFIESTLINKKLKKNPYFFVNELILKKQNKTKTKKPQKTKTKQNKKQKQKQTNQTNKQTNRKTEMRKCEMRNAKKQTCPTPFHCVPH